MGKSILLIASGAYSNSEIVSDFGLLPPSFLPIGHKRLIELLVEKVEHFEASKVISLPKDFEISRRDKLFFSKNNITVFRVNPNLTLKDSILYCIDFFDRNNDLENFYLLHGDTLFDKIDEEPNLLYCGLTDMLYKWGNLSELTGENLSNDHRETVIAGYFSFNNISVLKNELEKNQSFENVIKSYNNLTKFDLILKGSWLDFGHSNLYYKSKMDMNITREFNHTEANTNYIKKISGGKNKLKSEFLWFTQLPESLSRYIPSVWSLSENENSASYNIEFVGSPTLQEKWVFGILPDYTFVNILNEIFLFIQKASKITFKQYNSKFVKDNFEDLYINKTISRVEEFSRQSGFPQNQNIFINNKKYPPLRQFLNEVLDLIKTNISNEFDQKFTLMHGDLCFSNILWDSRSCSIKLIDPRGGLNQNFNSDNKLIGDYRYDLAKLGHSLVGNYDHIVTGFYSLDIIDNLSFVFNIDNYERELLEKYYFNKIDEMNVCKDFISASIVNLFLSMLPLHSDDSNRQIALLLNAYKLFYK